MLQLENNVWDAFDKNDDHVVPPAVDKHKNQFKIQVDSCKKSVCELHGIENSDYVSSYGTQGREQLYL